MEKAKKEKQLNFRTGLIDGIPIALGYLSGEPTRVFDEATEKAVLLFQRLNGLLETGMKACMTGAEIKTPGGKT